MGFLDGINPANETGGIRKGVASDGSFLFEADKNTVKNRLAAVVAARDAGFTSCKIKYPSSTEQGFTISRLDYSGELRRVTSLLNAVTAIEALYEPWSLDGVAIGGYRDAIIDNFFKLYHSLLEEQ